MTPTPSVLRYAERVAGAVPGAVVGVYLHGSAVLGGFRPEVSDIDILAVVAVPGSRRDQARMGEALLAAASPCPGAGLELSVITAGTAAALGTCPFEVHVATNPGGARVVCGAGHPGDPDLVLHVEVCRRHGRTVRGAPAERILAPVPVDRLREAIRAELRWAAEHSSLAYAVLTACRALRFAAEARLCSKVDAGEWFLARNPGHPVVAEALAQQRYGRPAASPLPASAARFVREVQRLFDTSATMT